MDQSRERTRGSLTSDTCLIEYMYICIHVQVAWIVLDIYVLLDTCTVGDMYFWIYIYFLIHVH